MKSILIYILFCITMHTSTFSATLNDDVSIVKSLIEASIVDIFSTDRPNAEIKLDSVETIFNRRPELLEANPSLELEWITAKCWLYYETGLDTDPILEFLTRGNTLANTIIATTKEADIACAHLYDITARCIITNYGEIPLAKYYFFKALDLKFNHLDEWNPDVLISKWNLIKLNNKEYLEARLEILKQNIELYKKHGNLNHFYIGFNYLELAGVYREGLIDENLDYTQRRKVAMEQYYKALNAFERTIGENAYANSYALHGISTIHLELGNQNKYNQFLHKSMALKKVFTTPKDYYLAYLEDTFVNEKTPLKSAEQTHKYLAYYFNQDTSDILANPVIDVYFRDNFRLLDKAHYLMESMKQNGIFSLDTLSSIVECGEAFIQQKKYEIYDDFIQREYLENVFLEQKRISVFEAAIISYEMTNDSKWLNKAYNILSFNKNLNVKVAEIKRIRQLELTKREERIKVLEDSITKYEIEAISYEKKGVIDNLKDISKSYGKAFDFQSKKDSLIAEIEHEIKSVNISFDNRISDIQKKLENNQLLIEYVPIPLSDNIAVFVLSNQNFKFKKLSNINAIYSEIDSLRHSILNTQVTNYMNYSNKIYEKLVKPIENDTNNKDLIIIPNGKLAYIPFDLLLYEQVDLGKFNKINFSELPYLFRKNVISYHYQSDFLHNQQKNRNSRNLSFVGFAPVAGSETELFAQKRSRSILDSDFTNLTTEEVNQRLRNSNTITLPASAWEISEITSNFVLGETLINEKATEEKFIETADKHDIIHIASHCIVDDEYPDMTRLVFSSESEGDGFLYLYELLQLNLTSELVILSACNTGFGKIISGEGISSIAYGFAHAGCPNIVMSQWAIYDDFSAKIMTNFYKYLDQGERKDRALQLAKLEFLSDSSIPNEFKQPYYWGGFQFIGNNAAISFYKGYSFLKITAIVLILVVIIIVLLKTRLMGRLK